MKQLNNSSSAFTMTSANKTTEAPNSQANFNIASGLAFERIFDMSFVWLSAAKTLCESLERSS
jgi:hypothetical protein